MKLLITGVCGFAGSVIARHLLEHSPGLSIVGFDNLSRKGSETNLEPLRALGIDVRVGDVRDRAFLDGLPPADWILDCAANPSVLAGVDDSGSRDLVDQNLYGTVNLLELCKQWKAGFILLSTSRVYSIPPLADLPLRETPTRFEPELENENLGRMQRSPQGEDRAFQKAQKTQIQSTDPTSSPLAPFAPSCGYKISGISHLGVSESFPTTPPVSLYGSTKLCSEWLALEYGSAFEFPVWVNRCGVLAGAGQFGKADQGIFSYWIHSWRAGRSLKYIGFGGTGKQVRDCLHPKDLIPLLLKQLDSTFRFPLSPFPKIINVSGGSTNSMSLLELSTWCHNRFGPHPASPATPNPQPATPPPSRPFDIPWMVLDPALAAEVWQWTPQIGIHDILEEIAQHAEANPNWLDLVT